MAENSAQRRTVIKTKHAQCTIYHYGAHISSWKVSGKEVMFLSKDAKLDGSRPIRGGVPLVFPQFGPGEMKQHGFARRATWTLKSQDSSEEKASATFSLAPNEVTKEISQGIWDFDFGVDFVVTLELNTLRTQFIVNNVDTKEMKFTCLYHTYFKLKDVGKLQIAGLKGNTYIDGLLEKKEFKEERNFVTISENVDRIYKDVKYPVSFHSGVHIVSIDSNVSDCVVWNPWIEKAKGMSDFGDEEYKNMVCVEPGACTKDVCVAPGESYEMDCTITVTSLK